MSNVLVIAQHSRHNAVCKVVQRSRGEDSLRPISSFLLLRVRGLIVFLPYEHQDTHGVVVESEALNLLDGYDHLT